MTRSLGRVAAVAAVGAVLCVPGAARAQVGAIGGAAGGAVAGDDAVARAPVFGESGLVLAAKSWSFGGYYGLTSGSDFVDFTFNQVVLGAFYAPAERLTLGLVMFPFNSVSSDFGAGLEGDESGMGDAVAYGKYQFARSADGRTSVAGIAQLLLPIGDADFGAAGTQIALAAAVSHQLSSATLHGMLGVGIPTDDDDGETAINFGGGVVFSASNSVSISGELLGSSESFDVGLGDSERYTELNIAPGVRVRLGDRLFLDTGVIYPLWNNQDSDVKLVDYAFMAGLTFTR